MNARYSTVQFSGSNSSEQTNKNSKAQNPCLRALRRNTRPINSSHMPVTHWRPLHPCRKPLTALRPSMLNIQSAKLFWIISSRLESVRRTKPKPVGCVNVNVPVFGCWLLWFNLMPHWQQTFRTGKNALNLQTRWRTGALSTNRFPPLSLVITRGGDGNWEKWKIFQKRFPRGKICYVNFTLTNGANLVVVNGCLYTQLTRLLRRGKPKINIYGGDIFICSTYHLPTIRKISQQRNPRFSFDFLFVSFLQSVFVGNNISWWMKHWTCYIWAGLSSKWVVSAGDQQRERLPIDRWM